MLARVAELEPVVIRDVAEEEAAHHQEPVAAKPRNSKRTHPLKTSERPLRSGEQRITQSEKKSRLSTIEAQTNRSFATLTASAARLPEQVAIDQQVGEHAAGARGRGAVCGAAVRGAGVHGRGAGVRGRGAAHARTLLRTTARCAQVQTSVFFFFLKIFMF